MRDALYTALALSLAVAAVASVALFCWALVWAGAVAGVPLVVGCAAWVARDVWTDVLGGWR